MAASVSVFRFRAFSCAKVYNPCRSLSQRWGWKIALSDEGTSRHAKV